MDFELSTILSKWRSSKKGAFQGGVGFGLSGLGGRLSTTRDVTAGVFISLLSTAVALVGEEDKDVLGHLTRMINLKADSTCACKVSISGHDKLNHDRGPS